MTAHRGTLPDIIHHHMPAGFPAAAMDLTPSEPAIEDEAICARLITAFQSAQRYERRNIPPERHPHEGIWMMNRETFHGEGYRLLEAQNARGLANYLCNCLRTSTAHGLGPGADVFGAASNPELSPIIATIIVDRMLAVAEAMALLPYENPEQGRWGANLYEDLPTVVEALQRACGHPIGFPRVFGNFGVAVGDVLMNVRTPDNIYTVYRMDALLNGLKERSVLEIGAGFGGTAYYGALRGLRNFSIVDLPFMNVLQGFFLIKVLGAQSARLFGERDTTAVVHVLPYWEIENFREGQFDITLNQDSLPELPLARALEYIASIPHYTKRFFYSINQESMGYTDRVDGKQLVVPRLIDNDSRYRRASRHPYWLRRGYVEEVYDLERSERRNGQAERLTLRLISKP